MAAGIAKAPVLNSVISNRSAGEQLRSDALAGGSFTDQPRYFNRMTRSAHLVSGDVLEVRSYFDMRIRVFCWCLCACAIIVAGFWGVFTGSSDYPFQDQIHAWMVLTDFRAAFYPEYLSQPRSESFDDWVRGIEEISSLHRAYAIRMLIASFFVSGPLFLVALLWPKRAPLRIDRKRWVAYSILKGEIAMVRIGTGTTIGTPFSVRLAAAPPLTLTLDTFTKFGPLLTGLVGIRSGKRRLFWMGAQPVTSPSQNEELDTLVTLFTDDRVEPHRWTPFLHRRSFLPGDILRALDHLSLRRRPNLDDPLIQARVDEALPNAKPVGDPILSLT